ncbi:helix-turn-helix domain-containing protein [Streptomyces sp. NPDC047315]|uniref:MmyB family transcriptional regulator n=1 Tax=Streptomyces sp. NPDC047315 TaxID=3155142 RepID=UPI0033C1A025
MTPQRGGLAEFLRSRRERLSPEQVGLSSLGRRRTPGLRRAEFATLADLSVEHLERLEQGRGTNPSSTVLAALAGALPLTVEEKRHLARLAASQHAVPLLDAASWSATADQCVGWLRAAEQGWGRDGAFRELLDDMRAVPEFAARWAAHPVASRRPVSNRVRHPGAGELGIRVEVRSPTERQGKVPWTSAPRRSRTPHPRDRRGDGCVGTLPRTTKRWPLYAAAVCLALGAVVVPNGAMQAATDGTGTPDLPPGVELTDGQRGLSVVELKATDTRRKDLPGAKVEAWGKDHDAVGMSFDDTTGYSVALPPGASAADLAKASTASVGVPFTVRRSSMKKADVEAVAADIRSFAGKQPTHQFGFSHFYGQIDNAQYPIWDLAKITGSQYLSAVYRSEFTATQVSGASDPTLGHPGQTGICVSGGGYATEERCGASIRNLNATLCVQGQCTNGLATFSRGSQSQMAGYGDSGGPVYFVNNSNGRLHMQGIYVGGSPYQYYLEKHSNIRSLFSGSVHLG